MFLFSRHRWVLLFLASLMLCLSIHALPIGLAAQPLQHSSAAVLVQQGVEHYQASEFSEAIALWQQALLVATSSQERAVIHTNLAHAHQQSGKLAQAIAAWEQAIQSYQSVGDATSHRQIASLLTEQAQAYSDLGQHQRAITLLQSATEINQKDPDTLTFAAIQGVLGNAYWALG